ncbi:glycosyltransferase family 2 protein [Brevundimonas sp. 2R-24]|uniref:Glycosyltransferase family 2 protein n=1 Tax=Peiella sedimenti TaxID=3061083 RepID=A0ABT8SP26_9CAUL|nr:glycosyltransferase family 2 protein [Caulobacteraceae bacterium XZ-24]
MSVAVIIPTFRRPDSLRRALASVWAQEGLGDQLTQIIIVDNDPDGSGRAVIAERQADARLTYIHEPRPGVSNARNAGVAAVKADLVAFLDDDEAASSGWLAALLDAQAKLQADVLFGPIRGRADDAEPWLRPYLSRFFGREGPTGDQRIEHAYGCGNSLLVRATALSETAPFDPRMNETGGEDDALFSRLAARGLVFGWAAQAWVDEFAPPERATLAYALKRAFAYGQGPSQTAARDRRPIAVLRWMAIGAAQATVFGALAGLAWLVRSPRRADLSDRAVRGLGKLLWMPLFEPRLYGQIGRGGPTRRGKAAIATG